MSEQDQRLAQLQEGVDAFNRGDPGPALALFADDVECRVAADLMNAGTYIGHDGYLDMIRNWGEAWDSIAAEIIVAEELPGGYLLVEIHQRAVGAGSGVPVEMRMFWLFGFGTGGVTRFHMYGNREAAIAAARE
jgi:ketosteroid isomerase-like protein